MSVKRSLLIVVFSLISPLLFAAAEVEISSRALVEEEVLNADGSKEMVRSEVEQIDSGRELIFELTVTNKGDEQATNLKIDNPVPEGTVYVTSPAGGEGTEFTVSHNGDEYFSEPDFMDSEFSVSDIRHLRWTLKSLNSNESVILEFRVVIK